mgnify:FL=1|tara:strand:- start:5137 stop:6309 length:1173 start_codon:yes stop_codon:yes gene_type:complete
MKINILQGNVLARPSPTIKEVFFTKSKEYLRPNFFFFSHGRNALLFGLRLFDMQKGSRILVPAYICKSISDSLINEGYEIIFQDINSELSLDLDLLKLNIKRYEIKAVLIVNFFGFTDDLNEIRKICNSTDSIFIEDNCHSYLSYDCYFRTDEKCDFSIFSLRKNLPIKEGGVLKINSKFLKKKIYSKKFKQKKMSISTQNEIQFFSKDDLIYLILRYVEKFISFSGIFNLYSQKLSFLRIQRNKKNKNLTFSPKNPSFLLSKYLTNEFYKKTSRKKILKNFLFLSQEMERIGFQPFKKLDSIECIPQYAIYYDDSEELVDYLRKNKIGASKWPAHEMPEIVSNFVKKYPISVKLNKKLLLIPIHQNIKINELRRIVNLIGSWKKIKSKD